MIFSKTTEYAVRILTYMEIKDEKFYSASKLHEVLELPYKYVTKLMTSLSKAGLIKTQMGRNGGYYIARPADKILLSDIIHATNDLKKLDCCVLGHSKCSEEDPCSLHNNWAPIQEDIKKLISSLNLKDLGSMDITKL